MQLVTAQNNLSQCLFLAVTQWESRLPVIKDGVREFFDAVPKIMHFIYSLAVLAWYTLVALGALGGFLIVGFFGLMRRSHHLGKRARQSEAVAQVENRLRLVVLRYVAPLADKISSVAQPLVSALQFAKTRFANFFLCSDRADDCYSESGLVATKSWLDPNSEIDDISF